MNELAVINILEVATLSEVNVTFKGVSATSSQLAHSLSANDACMA